MLIFSSFSVTTDSQTSEEDAVPPPLPIKLNSGFDNGSLFCDESLYSRTPSNRISGGSDRYRSFTTRPLPPTPSGESSEEHKPHVSHYEILEIKNREVISDTEEKLEKKSAPTPPPKPQRSSSRNSTMSP